MEPALTPATSTHTSMSSPVGSSPTVDATSPEIRGLKWEPSRIADDKIYDLNVSFEAVDMESNISDAYLVCEGIYPDEIPRRAIPEEMLVMRQIQPIDRKFDSKKGSFFADITGLNGGKEYRIKSELEMEPII